jgi:hypothetical protein
VVSVPMQADDGPDSRSHAIADQASKIQLTLPAFNPLQDARNGGYPASGTAKIGSPTGRIPGKCYQNNIGRDKKWLTISSAFTLVQVTGHLSS